MNLYNETKNIMKKYNISANKSLGQNFLIDDEVVRKIVEGAEVTKDDLVIEIGPGLGTLTKPLIERAGKVICVELDKRMLEILEDRFGDNDNFKVINDDVLKVDLNKLIQTEKKENNLKRAKIVANLPYYITTPIIMKLLEEKLDIESITVMIQKEVAKRITAIPGEPNSGAITYSVYYYAKAEEVILVPNTSFIPRPEVESEVIRLVIRDNPPIEMKDEQKVFKLIKQSFMQRRKTLVNSLAKSEFFNQKEDIEKILNKLEIDLKVRGETLSFEQFVKISEEI